MVAMAEPWWHPETGTYYPRRQIPKHLREEFGGRQIWKRSLNTEAPAEARRTFAAVHAELETRFEGARTAIAARAASTRLTAAEAEAALTRASALHRGSRLDRFPVLSKVYWAEEAAVSMWTPGRYAGGKPPQWGMGWPLRPDPRHPVATGIGGRRSAFFGYPKDDLAIVVLTNPAGADPEEFIGEIAGVFYPELRLMNGGGLSPAADRLRLALAAAPDGAPETLYAMHRRAGASFVASEAELNDWGGRLLGAGMQNDALRVFLLNTRLHPTSANTWDSLGEGYEARREPADAITSYRESLSLDDGNDHAIAHLKMLGASTGK